MDKDQWIAEVREYLNEEYTLHLYERALKTEDTNTLIKLIKRAKGIYAAGVSEADTLINKI